MRNINFRNDPCCPPTGTPTPTPPHLIPPGYGVHPVPVPQPPGYGVHPVPVPQPPPLVPPGYGMHPVPVPPKTPPGKYLSPVPVPQPPPGKHLWPVPVPPQTPPGKYLWPEPVPPPPPGPSGKYMSPMPVPPPPGGTPRPGKDSMASVKLRAPNPATPWNCASYCNQQWPGSGSFPEYQQCLDACRKTWKQNITSGLPPVQPFAPKRYMAPASAPAARVRAANPSLTCPPGYKLFCWDVDNGIACDCTQTGNCNAQGDCEVLKVVQPTVGPDPSSAPRPQRQPQPQPRPTPAPKRYMAPASAPPTPTRATRMPNPCPTGFTEKCYPSDQNCQTVMCQKGYPAGTRFVSVPSASPSPSTPTPRAWSAVGALCDWLCDREDYGNALAEMNCRARCRRTAETLTGSQPTPPDPLTPQSHAAQMMLARGAQVRPHAPMYR